MNSKRFLVLALVGVLALVAVACGGGGGDGDGVSDGGGGDGEIRVEKGLAVAARATGLQQEGGPSEGEDAAIGGDAIGAPDASLPGAGVTSSDRIGSTGYVPFPTLQQGQTGISVNGYGSATADADGAILEFYFSRYTDGVPVPSEPDGGTSRDSSGQAQPITEADLQPVVDAIVGAGVAAADVEVIVQGSGYYDIYYGGSATVRATVRDVSIVDGVVAAAQEAAAGLGGGTNLDYTNVSYTVTDCAALERAAMNAAVEDARERGQTFAGVLGVSLGPVQGASNYTSSPYGGTPCQTGGFGPYYPLAEIAYAAGQPAEVEVVAWVSITFGLP